MPIDIPNGAIATYTGTWGLGLHFRSADSFVSDVGKNLGAAGLTVLSADVSGGFLASLEVAPITVILKVLNQSGIDMDDADFLQAMTDACSGAGVTIVSQSITATALGSAGGSHQADVPTGQPGQVPPVGPGSKAHACGDPSWSFFDDPGQWFSCLASKGLSTLGLLFIGLLVGVVLVVAAEKKVI
jgi:hypothetical protein